MKTAATILSLFWLAVAAQAAFYAPLQSTADTPKVKPLPSSTATPPPSHSQPMGFLQQVLNEKWDECMSTLGAADSNPFVAQDETFSNWDASLDAFASIMDSLAALFGWKQEEKKTPKEQEPIVLFGWDIMAQTKKDLQAVVVPEQPETALPTLNAGPIRPSQKQLQVMDKLLGKVQDKTLEKTAEPVPTNPGGFWGMFRSSPPKRIVQPAFGLESNTRNSRQGTAIAKEPTGIRTTHNMESKLASSLKSKSDKKLYEKTSLAASMMKKSKVKKQFAKEQTASQESATVLASSLKTKTNQRKQRVAATKKKVHTQTTSLASSVMERVQQREKAQERESKSLAASILEDFQTKYHTETLVQTEKTAQTTLVSSLTKTVQQKQHAKSKRQTTSLSSPMQTKICQPRRQPATRKAPGVAFASSMRKRLYQQQVQQQVSMTSEKHQEQEEVAAARMKEAPVPAMTVSSETQSPTAVTEAPSRTKEEEPTTSLASSIMNKMGFKQETTQPAAPSQPEQEQTSQEQVSLATSIMNKSKELENAFPFFSNDADTNSKAKEVGSLASSIANALQQEPLPEVAPVRSVQKKQQQQHDFWNPFGFGAQKEEPQPTRQPWVPVDPSKRRVVAVDNYYGWDQPLVV